MRCSVADARCGLVPTPRARSTRGKRAASQDGFACICRSGVGPIAALTFKAAVIGPSHFKRSRTALWSDARRFRSGGHDETAEYRTGETEIFRVLSSCCTTHLLMRTWQGCRLNHGACDCARKVADGCCRRPAAVLLHRLWSKAVNSVGNKLEAA
jgi:hypothetical protein